MPVNEPDEQQQQQHDNDSGCPRVGHTLTADEFRTWLSRGLVHAVSAGDAELAETMLQMGASPDSFVEECTEDRVLHLAATKDDEHTVRALVLHGAVKDKPNHDGDTPLHLAAKYNNVSAACALLHAGAHFDLRNKSDQSSALDLAPNTGHLGVVGPLPRYEADANGAKDTGHTALHEAAAGSKTAAMEKMVNTGARVNVHDRNGQTPLHVAATNDFSGVIESLIKSSADVSKVNTNAKDKVGRTPLHRACEQVSTEAVRCLLANGVTVNARDKNRQSPLHRAASVARDDNTSVIVDMLLRADADETALDTDDLTPAQVVGHDLERQFFWPTSERPDNSQVLQLLKDARADRTWRRRHFLVMCRALPDKAPIKPEIIAGIDNTSSEETYDGLMAKRCTKLAKVQPGRGDVGAGNGGGGIENLVARVVGMGEEEIFQRIVNFL